MKTALLIVDVQNDFLPGGALAVPHGDEVIPRIKKLAPEYDLVITTGDWHPRDTPHFDKWPAHCVSHTEGAEVHPAMAAEASRHVDKGMGEADGYSAFEGVVVGTESPLTHAPLSLARYLTENGVKAVTVVGLALDYCVKWTAKDAASNGFATTVLLDATRPVETNTGWYKTARDLDIAGVRVL